MRRNMMEVAQMIAKKRKMAAGGMVEPAMDLDHNDDPMIKPQKPEMHDAISTEQMDRDADSDNYTMNENRMNSYTNVMDGEVANPAEQEEAMMFAKALRSKAMSMNQANYAMGGLVQPMQTPAHGNEPDLDLDHGVENKGIADGVGAPEMREPKGPPMSPGMMEAIQMKKKMKMSKMMRG